MERIKELIKKLQGEGKSVSEIAGEVAKLQEAKELATDSAKLAEMIKTEIRAIEVAAEVAKSEKINAEKSALKSEVESTVKEVLKAMPAIKEPDQKEVKYFDHGQKKAFSTKQNCSEGLKAFARLVEYVGKGDHGNAEAVQKEILAEKVKEYEKLGIKAALYSNATTGSYLIPTEVEMAIFERAYQGVMLSRVNTNAIVYNEKLFPVMADMSFSFIATENTQIGDKTPTISNPSVAMARFGGMAYLSNALLNMPTGLMSALSSQFGSALQKFADFNLVCASVSETPADPFNGIAFDANTKIETPKALTAITIEDLFNLKNSIDQKYRSEAIYLANEKVRDAFGLLENTAGNEIFSQFINTGVFNPLGKEFVVNDQIPSTFTTGLANKLLNGTSDIVMAVVPKAVYAGFEPLRIATSEHLKFDYDQFAIRCVSRMGVKVVSTTGTSGYVASALELTN